MDTITPLPPAPAPARSVAFIPDDEVERLQALRNNRDLPGLRSRILALRNAGWTLAGIGAPFQVPYSTVRAWERAATPDTHPIPHDDVPTPGRPPRRPGHVIRVRKMRPDVPPSERQRLSQLAEEARILRRTTSPTHPAWHSQRILEDLLTTYIERGVPIANLARYCNVSNRAIAARMERAEVRRQERQQQAS
jgi:hypothetical protein